MITETTEQPLVTETSPKASFLQLEAEIVKVLKSIFDPEIPVNIYDLGLIYEIEVNEQNDVFILMTVTSPNCPVADSLPEEVRQQVSMVKGVASVSVNMTFDPPWDKNMLSEEAMLELGFL